MDDKSVHEKMLICHYGNTSQTIGYHYLNGQKTNKMLTTLSAGDNT